MTLTPEMKSIIDNKMIGVNSIRRSGLSHFNFLDDYGSLIANTEKNLAALVKAGFDETELPYYRGCLEMLALTIGDRTSTDVQAVAKSQEYARIVADVAVYRVELGVVGRSIAKNSGNRKVQQKYKQIIKGSGDIDNAIDILGLVSMVQSYPELAVRIRPDGKTIDENYCKNASEKAMALLQLKGYVVVNGVPQNNGTDYLNRLITLCIDNQSDIKEFAQAAFCKDPDFYNANFTSKFRKNNPADDTDDLNGDSSGNGSSGNLNNTSDIIAETAVAS